MRLLADELDPILAKELSEPHHTATACLTIEINFDTKSFDVARREWVL